MTSKALRGGSVFDVRSLAGSNQRYDLHLERRYDSSGFRILRPTLKFRGRMLRGGSWFDFRNRAHKTSRLYNPLPRDINYGFRVAR